MRKLFGTIVGILVAILILAAIEYVDGALYPLPTNIDPQDVVAIAQIIPNMPIAAKLILVSAWLLATFGGAWFALRVTDWRWSAVLVTLFVIGGAVVNFVELPHPLWMQGCAVLLPLIGGGLAARAHAKPYPGEPLLG